MRILRLFLVINVLSFFRAPAFASISDSLDNVGTKLCKIVKIKRHHDMYIIYASCDKNSYKIVSPKEKNMKGVKIQIGKVYELALYSYFGQSDIFHSVINFKVSPGTIISADKETRDLYYSINLRGLKYTKENELSNIDSALNRTITIDKIKKYNNYFIIFASAETEKFKIVSLRDDTCCCKEIRTGNKINVNLRSYYEKQPWQVRYMAICFAIAPNVEVSADPETKNLFYSNNFKGLCFIEYKR